MGTLIASREGAAKLQQARDKSGRTVDSPRWLEEASKLLISEWKPGDYYAIGVNEASWRRFLYRTKPIKEEIFKAYCSVLGLSWEEVVEVTAEQSKVSLTSFFALDDFWVGRTDLLKDLKNTLQASCRVLVLTGITGIGKTSLAERLATELQDDWLELCRINFDDEEKSSDFASVATELLIGWKEDISSDDRKNPQKLSNLLVKHLQESYCLLIFDSLEKILYGDETTGWNNFRDDWWKRFFNSVMASESFHSRIIVTSQDLPADIEEVGLRYKNFWCCRCLYGLTSNEQMELFRKTKITLEKESGSYLERIGVAYEGHPLALRVIAGEIIASPFYGNVLAYWKKYGHEIEEVEQSVEQERKDSSKDSFKLDRLTTSLQRVVKKLLERSFERLARDIFDAYLLLCHSSVYRHPVPDSWWLEHLSEMGISQNNQVIALTALRERYLIEESIINDEVYLRQHNLIRSVSLTHLDKLITYD